MSLNTFAQLLALILLTACQQSEAATRLYVGGYYYTYSSYTYYYSYPIVSVGAIIGAVIGGLTFIGLIIGLIIFLCCIRQRRRASAAARARVPMTVGGATVVATVTPGAYPAAPDTGLPYDYPKQNGYPGVSSPPPPYPVADAAYYNNGYSNEPAAVGTADPSSQNGRPLPPYPAQQMPPYPAQQMPQHSAEPTTQEQRF